MFKKSIKDPFEVEIRIPNQHDWPQDLSLHQAQLLRLLKLRKLHEHCNLQIKEQRVDLAKNTSLLTSTFNHHFQDMKRLGEADYRQSLHFAQNRGYMLLAGRLVPQPIIRVSTDIKTTLPLSLGLHGDPGHLEKVNPCPPQLLPQPEAAVWQKVRQSQEDGGKIYEQAKEIELLQHSQRVRRALAAIDYGEQKQKEPIQAVSHGHLPDADPRLTAESILDLALQKKI